MNFDFSEDHRVIQDQIRRFLADKSPLARFRDVIEERDRYAEDVWQGLAAMGIQGTAIDEAYGGVGLGYLPTMPCRAVNRGAALTCSFFELDLLSGRSGQPVRIRRTKDELSNEACVRRTDRNLGCGGVV